MPFAGGQNFHFAIDQFHRNGLLIKLPRSALLIHVGKGQRYYGERQNADGHQDVGDKHPALAAGATAGWKTGHHNSPALMIATMTLKRLTTMKPTNNPFRMTRPEGTTCAADCCC